MAFSKSKKGSTTFKKGGLDANQVLFNQVDRTMRCLTESNYVGFVDGVEGLYLILFPVIDDEFRSEDKKLFEGIAPDLKNMENDISIWPEDKTVMFTALGIRVAKMRLANLMLLAQRNRFLFEKRRVYGESTDQTEDPTEEELEEIVGDSFEEE